MSFSGAWLKQSESDKKCMEVIFSQREDILYCQIIEKAQKVVEKSIKAILAALDEVHLVSFKIGYNHQVTRDLRVLLSLPAKSGKSTIQNHLHGLLSGSVRGEIQSIESLIPRRPPGSAPPAKNTEYPFQDAATGEYHWPADNSSFSLSDAERYRQLAIKIHIGADRVISAIRRLPPKKT